MKFILALLVGLATPALAQEVTTVVGTGTAGYSGDGGPAAAAEIRDPQGIAFDSRGNLYIADNQNFVIRRVDSLGVITTVAGNGLPGFSGDGGPATLARFGSPVGIHADSAGNLYIADQSNHRIRRVDASTGVIQTIAGNGLLGFTGDGGPATSARLNTPQGVGVDSQGNVYVADTSNFRVRRVDAVTGIITTVAGNGFPTSTGDGGPATAATLSSPRRLEFDFEDNLFILDRATNARIRRVDRDTGIITTIAGGGSQTGDSGIATQMNLGPLTDVAMDGRCNILATSSFRAWRISRGTATAIAGTGAQGYGGDGGDPLLAVFNNVSGAAVNGRGEVFLSDRSNNRIRKISLSPTEVANLEVSAGTLQSVLDGITAIKGSLRIADADGRTTVTASFLQTVGLDFIVAGNGDLVLLETPGLLSVCGVLRFSNNLILDQLALPSLVVLGGDLFIDNNPAVGDIDLAGVTVVGGDLSITDNASAANIDLGGLGDVGGDLAISSNASADGIDLGGLGDVGGDLAISSNASAGAVDLGGLGDVGGDLAISSNASADSIDLGTLTSVGGSVLVTNNTAATAINLGSLTSAPGTVTVTNNTAATNIDLSSLLSVGGSATISDNGTAPILLDSLASVGVDLTIGTQGQDTVALPNAEVGGNLTITAGEASMVIANTAGGTTSVSLLNGSVAMSVDLPPGTFVTPVSFSIEQVPPPGLEPGPGLDAGGGSATVDPLVAYSFSFAVSSLNQPGALTFDIRLDSLDTTTRAALLAALNAGQATLVVKGEAPDTLYQALRVCGPGEVPEVDNCVAITYPDSGTVRFSGVAGHFSTWAVAIVTPASSGVSGDRPAPPAFALDANEPNPFGSSTRIRFDLPVRSPVSLRVYDLQGRLVRTLLEGVSFGPGRHTVAWDGRLEGGGLARPGVYFYKLGAGRFSTARRMIVLR